MKEFTKWAFGLAPKIKQHTSLWRKLGAGLTELMQVCLSSGAPVSITPRRHPSSASLDILIFYTEGEGIELCSGRTVQGQRCTSVGHSEPWRREERLEESDMAAHA